MRACFNWRPVAGTAVRALVWLCGLGVLTEIAAGQCLNPTQVPDQTISSVTRSFVDSNALSANNVTINGSASVAFTAGNCIQLLPNFHATAGTAGTTFHAWVDTSPSNVSVSPSSGSGLSQQFMFTVASPSGYSNISEVQGLFGCTPGTALTHAMSVMCEARICCIWRITLEPTGWAGSRRGVREVRAMIPAQSMGWGRRRGDRGISLWSRCRSRFRRIFRG
jgi:hypothetical protein